MRRWGAVVYYILRGACYSNPQTVEGCNRRGDALGYSRLGARLLRRCR